jgi:type II secretory pathway component GspD/PulD (secretin)
VARAGNGQFGLALGAGILLAVGCLCWPTVAAAQPPNAMPANMSPEQMKAIAEAQARAKGGNQPKPGEQPKPDEKKEGEKKDDDKDKKKEEVTSIKRPEKPPRVPDPREFDMKLDKSGRVPPFNFIGQTWPDVLQWLANISSCSLDWQELPNDYLNLTTQTSYPPDEVRDLINRHLHARGYTLLVGNGVLSVFKIEEIDPSLVPRVTEDELYDHKPYDFVKVSFELPQGMEVDKAKEDVKQMLGPHAKLFPLAATKRILVIDAVANLRSVSELLNQERLVQDGRIVPREFPLKHARAEQIIDVLYVVVGLDPKSRPSQMELQMQQQKLQLMMQMQQKGTDVSKMLKQDGPSVYLAYNRQRNSVLVNAPPEYMKIIERTIRYLDVPAQGAQGNAGPIDAANESDRREFKKYRLETLDPERLVMTLEEIGGLDPWTELRPDKSSNSLWVQASAADQAKIERLIKQFDGEGREFYVLRLRRIAADLAAMSIKELMVGEEKKDDDDNNRRYYYWGGSNRNEEKEKSPHDGFRVTADVESNRLMLRATEEEMADVRKMLAQMGEVPPEQSNPEPVRFVQPGSDAARDRLLEQLKAAWPSLGGNELIIRVPEEAAAPVEKKPVPEAPAGSPDAESSAAAPPPRLTARFAQLNLPSDRPEESVTAPPAHSSAAPPVTVSVTSDGRLMLSSADTAALDRLEELIEQISPPEKRFKVFHLDYVTAYSMYLTLYDYFEEEIKGEQDVLRDYWGDPIATVDKPMGSGLGRRKRLMITWDTASNTILAANANARQLWEIDELIKEYDKPAPSDSIKSRRTAAIKIRYSKASTIAAALKDVYRDLLSSRDREFQSGDKKEDAANQERTTIIRYGGFGSDDSGDTKRPTPVKLGFEGALSVGVDEISNMLIVSVQEELFDNVVRMVQQLDEEARPRTTVVVHRVSGQIDAKSLQKALSESLSAPWPGGRPEKPEAAQAAGKQKPQGEPGKSSGDGGGSQDD